MTTEEYKKLMERIINLEDRCLATLKRIRETKSVLNHQAIEEWSNK